MLNVVGGGRDVLVGLLGNADKGLRLLGGFVVLMGEERVAGGLVGRCEERGRRRDRFGWRNA